MVECRGPKAKSKELYDLFRSNFGSPCCRVLTKKFKHDEKAVFKHCLSHTGEVAELAARFILEERPELARQADRDFLTTKDSMIKAGLSRLLVVSFGQDLAYSCQELFSSRNNSTPAELHEGPWKNISQQTIF